MPYEVCDDGLPVSGQSNMRIFILMNETVAVESFCMYPVKLYAEGYFSFEFPLTVVSERLPLMILTCDICAFVAERSSEPRKWVSQFMSAIFPTNRTSRMMPSVAQSWRIGRLTPNAPG